MPYFLVTRHITNVGEMVVEADSVEEAKTLAEEQSESLDWEEVDYIDEIVDVEEREDEEEDF